MATIFLSYRREDGAQASRIHDWLTARFGEDAVFMDVKDIPFAVSYPEFLQKAIESSRVLLALIGPGWADGLDQETDPVRRELECASSYGIPVLPVLIGTTPMPAPDQMPNTITHLSSQNALTVDVLHGFHAHMQSLLLEVEGILGTLATATAATDSPRVINEVCYGVLQLLHKRFRERGPNDLGPLVEASFIVITGGELDSLAMDTGVTLLLHRTSRIGELLELHFLLSFWAMDANTQNLLAGWALHHLERTPVLPDEFLDPDLIATCEVRVRQSDEDPRQVWQMIADQPLRLSQAYVAMVAPRVRAERTNATGAG